jgi:hypothetical protein
MHCSHAMPMHTKRTTVLPAHVEFYSVLPTVEANALVIWFHYALLAEAFSTGVYITATHTVAARRKCLVFLYNR